LLLGVTPALQIIRLERELYVCTKLHANAEIAAAEL